jgi:hypothetical protein
MSCATTWTNVIITAQAIRARHAGQRPSLHPGRSGNVADPSQADMQNRLMAGKLAGAGPGCNPPVPEEDVRVGQDLAGHGQTVRRGPAPEVGLDRPSAAHARAGSWVQARTGCYGTTSTGDRPAADPRQNRQGAIRRASAPVTLSDNCWSAPLRVPAVLHGCEACVTISMSRAERADLGQRGAQPGAARRRTHACR